MNIRSFVFIPDSPADSDIKFTLDGEYFILHPNGAQELLMILLINSPSLESVRYRISSYKEIYKRRYPTEQDLLANTIMSISQSLLDKYPGGANVPGIVSSTLKDAGLEVNSLTALYLPFDASIWEDAMQIAREEMMSYN